MIPQCYGIPMLKIKMPAYHSVEADLSMVDQNKRNNPWQGIRKYLNGL